MDAVSGANKSRGSNLDIVFDNSNKKAQLSLDDFLQMMVAQLANQDFTNPVDDSQYLSQMAQFATMQQMQELAYYSKSNYVMGLVGKEATAAKITLGANVEKTTGIITKISLVDGEYTIYIGDKAFTLDQIMEVQQPKNSDTGTDKPTDDKDEGDKNEGDKNESTTDKDSEKKNV